MQQIAGLAPRTGDPKRGKLDRYDASRATPGERALIRMDGATLWRALVLVAAFLWVMHLIVVANLLAGSRMPATDRFHLDVEANLPTYFSVMNLVISAVLLGFIALVKKHDKNPYAVHWAMLSVVFFIMSVDEGASLHELLINPLRSAFDLTGYLRFSWVLVGGPFVLVFAYVYSQFLLALPRPVAGMFLLSGSIFVAGAIGFEMVGARFFGENNMHSWQYLAAMTAEEMLEMGAILLFIRTLLAYLRNQCTTFTLRLA